MAASDHDLILDEKMRAKTQNNMGYSHKNPSIAARAFYNHAQMTKGYLADIGCAYGFDTLEALNHGARVVAIDQESAHLDALHRSVSEADRKNLTTLKANFPGQVNFNPNTFDGILLSRVLLFLKAPEIELALQKTFEWLKPGGKVFILSLAPFGSEALRAIWEAQVRQNEKWPGNIKDLWTLIPETQTVFPQTIQLLEENSLGTGLKEVGFVIEEIGYESNNLRGKDIYAIAHKPLN